VRLLVIVAALLASLAITGPAAADDPPTAVTVGEGQVITDPASETEPADAVDTSNDGSDVPAADDGEPGPKPPPDASGRSGELHVLGSGATAYSAPPAAAAAPAAASAPAPAIRTAVARRRGTLPFTGVDAGALALVGLALLVAGSGLLVVLRQPLR
jgi:hypothetical protein